MCRSAGSTNGCEATPGIFLDWDILFGLASYLPRSSLIIYMSTCKELRDHGVHSLLAEHGPISFSSARAIESFHCFITSDIATGDSRGRGMHIRMLDLRTNSEKLNWALYDLSEPSVLAHVVEILWLATGLQTLHISGFALWLNIFRDHLRALPSIFSTLRRLQFSIGSLRTLGSEWRPEQITELLQDVKHIPLRVLVVDSYFEDSDLRPSIVQLFSVFADTIEELHVSNSIFVLPPMHDHALRFPRVQRLSVSGLYWTHSSLTDLGSIIAYFPNMRSLAFGPPFYCIPIGRRNPLWWQAAVNPSITVSPPRTIYSLVSMTNMQPPAIIREDALREQHGLIQQNAGWTALDYLGGCCDHLYGLAITSKVDRLDIYDTITLGTAATMISQVNTILRDCSPTRVSLTVTYSPKPEMSTQDGQLADLLPRPLPRPLQYLQINTEGRIDTTSLRSQLPGLVVRATGAKTVIVTHKGNATTSYTNLRTENEVGRQHKDFVSYLASLSPTLRYIGLPEDLFGPNPVSDVNTNSSAILFEPEPEATPTLYWAIEYVEGGDICVNGVSLDIAVTRILELTERPIVTSVFE
ncbi:hypothetical protein BDY19DRAFT_28824 [Irpex rosettiformis]|uniref:Uncharacterized protein n=1 Tax=Irpex rosettiformis TaxID=378272 RepID=A0ACB8UJS7_9APHY|nr:hypothetical protein BDY19DRAFT_28824 [Irpex rosettiformis]